MTTRALRKTGIDAIGDAPWGTHFCQFYETTQDLFDILVPYFKAGLENNEFCMWVTSPPLVAKEAEAALRRAVPDLDRYLERGQIEIIPYTQWYVVDGGFDSQRVLDGWVAKAKEAKGRGFDGLRLSGNTFWLEKPEWGSFAAYEEEVNNVIGNYDMMAICTYSLEKCGATEIVDVIATHQFALIKREGRWETIESAERRKLADERNQVRATLRETEERLQMLFDHLNEGFALHQMIYDENGTPVDYRFLAVNPAFEQLTGLRREEVLGRTVREVIPGVEQHWIDTYGKVARTGEPARLEGFAAPLGRYYDALAFSPAKDQFAVLFLDVTERKRWEEEIKSVARFPAENPSPVLRVGSDGTLLYANPASGVLSPRVKLAVGKPAPAPLRRIAERALAEQSNITVNIELGDRAWSFSVAPIPEAGYANLYGRDITERRRAARALRNEKKISDTVIESLPGIFYLFDSRGRFLRWNRNFERVSGYSSKQMARARPQDFFSNKDRPLIERMIAEVFAKGEASVEAELVSKNGSSTPYFLTGLRTVIGDDECVVGMGIDVSESKKMAEALRRSEADLRRAQTVGNIGNWRLNVRENVLEWSDETYRIFGIAPGTPLTYQSFLACVHPEDREAVDRAWQAALRGERYDIDHRIVVGNSIKWIRELAELEFDENGVLRGGFGTCQDITERKQAEEELRRANAVKDEFIGMVSHELRTPLTAIIGAASLLLSGTPLTESDRRGLVEDIRAGAQRLARIIDNMLALARADIRKPQLQPLDIDAILDEIISQHRERYGHREVRKRIVGGALPTAIGLREFIVPVVSNLLENAEKYAPDDRPIEIDVWRDGDEITVCVSDRGIGLKPDEIGSLFDPFFRSEKAQSLSPGVGIGLTVCKRLVEAMGGRIWASPREGGGSEFGFALPAADGP